MYFQFQPELVRVSACYDSAIGCPEVLLMHLNFVCVCACVSEQKTDDINYLPRFDKHGRLMAQAAVAKRALLWRETTKSQQQTGGTKLSVWQTLGAREIKLAATFTPVHVLLLCSRAELGF